MRFGDKEVEIGPIGADQTVKLIKLVGKIWDQVQEDQRLVLLDGFEKSNWRSFMNILSPQFLYELTAILAGISKKDAQKGWTLGSFSELLAELSEKEDLEALVKNLQRVAGAYQS